MEQNRFKFQAKDFIPIYGAMRYLRRSTDLTFDEQEPSIRDSMRYGLNCLAQIAYNSVIGIEILNMLEGKPSFTKTLLEKLF